MKKNKTLTSLFNSFSSKPMFMESNDLPLRGPSFLFEYMLKCSWVFICSLFFFFFFLLSSPAGWEKSAPRCGRWALYPGQPRHLAI